mmetsp:Transcript_5571/g.15557  ORF Transcript_5571/g.15557 Transcript_5571/m.15557 type:complete len:245 (+) Transcript_5571:174-908(+)
MGNLAHMGKRACLNKLTQIPVHQAASSLYNQLPVVKLHGLAARPLEKRSDLSPFMVFAEPPSCVAMAPNTEARAPPRSLAPHCARLSAISRGDSPPESTAFVLAPAWRRMSTALPCPLTTAQWSGVRPQLSVTSTGSPTPLAPLLLPCRPPPFLPFCLLPPPAAQRSSSAVHTLVGGSARAAWWSTVCPESSLAPSIAPASSSASSSSGGPLRAATCKGCTPAWSAEFGEAPALSRAAAAAAWL